MPKSNPSKPQKPYPDFPLTAHLNGQWCKKIRGKVHFFGVWSDPIAARDKYLDERDDLQAGRTPNRLSHKGKPTTADLVNAFLHRSDARVKAGELSPLSWNDYRIIGAMIVDNLGRTSDPEKLRPVDFATFRSTIAHGYSPSRISKVVATTRMMIKWAFESELIDRMPRFGPDFMVSSKKQMRLHRAQQGKKLLNAEEIQQLLDTADKKWKAIILLCVNGGLGNSDISRLTLSDVSGEWMDLPRGKTGVDRRIPLWTETRDAIADAIPARPVPKPGSEQVVFLSKHGSPMIVHREDGKKTDLTIEGFRRLTKAAGIHRDRKGLYWLRHTFQTIGDGAGDPMATSHIMGHIDSSMAGQYREQIDDSRLLKVTNHVHSWLFKTVKDGE